MIKIYHNSRCKKSRQGLDFLTNSGKPFEVVNYLKNPIGKAELTALIQKTGKTPIELIRSNEDYFKLNIRGKNLSDDAIIDEILKHPQLLHRPVVELDRHAIHADPAENMTDLPGWNSLQGP